MDLELVTTEDLISELKKRHDIVIFYLEQDRTKDCIKCDLFVKGSTNHVLEALSEINMKILSQME